MNKISTLLSLLWFDIGYLPTAFYAVSLAQLHECRRIWYHNQNKTKQNKHIRIRNGQAVCQVKATETKWNSEDVAYIYHCQCIEEVDAINAVV